MDISEQEQRWIVGMREGRLDVYEEIFRHFTPQLIRFARLSVSREVAEDIVQDVMFNLWAGREAIVVQNGLAPYLFGAVRNRISSWVRHERIVHRTEGTTEEEHPPGMGTLANTPEVDLMADDLRSAIRHALNRLSRMQREIITLRWEHEMTYDKIASILSISVSAAQQHGSRAQRIIRPLLIKFVNRTR